MNAIRWKRHVRQALTAAHKKGRKRAVMLYGDTGLGKTQSTESAFKGLKCPECGAHDVPVVVEHLAELLPEDPRGFQVYDAQDKVLRWEPNPIWKIGSKCPIAYVLDEYNQAERPVRKAAMRMTTKFEMGPNPLPAGSIMILIGNEAEHNADVDELFRPERTRLRHLKFEFDPEAWFEWAVPKGLHPYVISFLHAKESYLHKPELHARYGEANPRSWEAVSNDLEDYDEQDWDEVVAGEIGDGIATEFVAWTATAGKLMPIVERVVSGENVLAGELSAQFFIGSVLVDRLAKQKKLSERICQYAIFSADRVPEAAAVMVKDGARVDKAAMMASASWKKAVERLSDYVV